MRKETIFIFALVVLLAAACSFQRDGNEATATVENENDEIFIVDRTGKRWNVTHAVNAYGFKAEEFQFGLGPFAIRPIILGQLGQMYEAGDSQYPSDDSDILVMGVKIEGDVRAYPISVMSQQEVADESFGSTPVHVAVAY